MLALAALALLMQTTVSMVDIPAGSYRPLYGRANDAPTGVRAFSMDRNAVTRGEFLGFVRTHAEWRRSNVRSLFADRLGYLSNFTADLDAGDSAMTRRAVTGVSWYAARAYCVARSARLPTVAEWEYAASASGAKRYASRDHNFLQEIVSLYATRSPSGLTAQELDENVYGLRGMHGLVWEWVEDFNSVLVSDDSRNTSERNHDLFCASAAIGAVDPSNYPAFLRYALRAGLSGRSTLETLGFRCAS